MRKTWIWLMLVLLPLRLWAGTLMPLPMPLPLSLSLPEPALLAVVIGSIQDDRIEPAHASHFAPAVHPDTHAQHPGHAAEQGPPHVAEHDVTHGPQMGHHSAAEASDTSKAEGCHEGPGCSACAVCHLSASLPGSACCSMGYAVHTVPVQGPWVLHDHAWPPLIKPPIS